MKTLNRNQIIALSATLAGVMEYMEADKIYVETSHQHFTGEPRANLNNICGHTLSVITEEFGEVEICTPSYNNFLPHNLIAIHF